MNYQFEKHFTPAEAREMLPLVRRIVQDILDASYRLKSLGLMLGEELGNSAEIKKLASEINGYIEELQALGCFYKDWSFSIGLVDFPAIINGQEVFLCWRSDEEDILYYHEIEAGYSGRKPLPAPLLSNKV